MLETDRLILRPFNADDTDAVFALRSDFETMRFIREPQPRDEAVNWMKLVSSRWATERIGLGAVVEKASGAVIGWCGLWRLPETDETDQQAPAMRHEIKSKDGNRDLIFI
jgi:RimJ/RimL family protein N-acetyltransferase